MDGFRVAGRLWRGLRQPACVAAVACGLVACFLVAFGGLAQLRLESGIAGLARGAYDILVRPENGVTEADASSTDGLIEPNFLSFAGRGGISLAELSAVSDIAGVEVAAPISVVGQVTSAWSMPGITFPDSSQGKLYELTLTQQVFDGVTLRTVSVQQFRVAIPGGSDPSMFPATTLAGPGGGRGNKPEWYVIAAPLPQITSSVVAVDPIAEQELVGHPVQALTQLAELRDRSSKTFTMQTLTDAMVAAKKANKLSGAAEGMGAGVPLHSPKPVVPIIATKDDPATMTLTVHADLVAQGSKIDQLLASANPASELQTWPVSGPPMSSSTVTVDARTSVLAGIPVGIGIGGSSGEIGGGGSASQIGGFLIGRPEYQVLHSQPGAPLSVAIEPLGPVPATGPSAASGPDESAGVGMTPVVGKEQSYRKTQVISGGQATLVPVRSFDPKQLIPQSTEEGRVSLGAYDIPDLVVAQSQLAATGTVIRPTLNVAGLAVRPPAGIADMRDAELLRGPQPIDAIRVRVAGVSRVDAATEQRVDRIAADIRNLGLRADVVIGSSPQEVAIQVPGYLDAQSTQVSLGTVHQRWTTMGAATRVSSGLSGLTVGLVALTSIVALLMALSAQLIGAGEGRHDAAILRVVGWSRRRVRLRLLAVPLITSGVALAAFGLTWLLSPRDGIVGLIGLALCLFVPVTAVLTSWRIVGRSDWFASRAGDVRPAARRSPMATRSLGSLAIRTVTATPARSWALVGLILTVVAGSGLAAATLADRVIAAGPTILAKTMITALTDEHAGILVVAAVFAAGFAAYLWRQTLRSTAHTEMVLRSTGWADSDITRLRRRVLAIVLIPAALAAILATWLFWAAVGPTMPPVAAVASTVAAAVIGTLFWMQSRRRRTGTSDVEPRRTRRG